MLSGEVGLCLFPCHEYSLLSLKILQKACFFPQHWGQTTYQLSLGTLVLRREPTLPLFLDGHSFEVCWLWDPFKEDGCVTCVRSARES